MALWAKDGPGTGTNKNNIQRPYGGGVWSVPGTVTK